jgi:DNA helicase-2/ATP-dependent DNA helicase PcrA
MSNKLKGTKTEHFNFGRANPEQRRAIEATNGPVLIIAGPGTGKTFTLVQRAVYLIQEKGVKPEQIMMATFTEKSARELITRISNAIFSINPTVNLNDMYIGTFHSICLRIIKENLEYSNIKKNYRTLDAFGQAYTVMREIYRFKNIENFESVIDSKNHWKTAGRICGYVNNLSEELVDPAILIKDADPRIAAMGHIMEKYNEILDDQILMDFSRLQTECYRLLKDNPAVLEKLRRKIKYLMIDEYQDTNYIQEQLIFLLGRHSVEGESSNNICVVGDDDQGLYRFRGATIRNIIEFPHRFKNEECKVIKLEKNYRSNSDIVKFYNTWMQNPQDFEWQDFRYQKEINTDKGNIPGYPAVLKISGEATPDSWHWNIFKFINELRDTKKITDLNQIAFLFRSVKGAKAVTLARFLDDHGIKVYSPRSEMFFEREEVKLVVGILLYLFPLYTDKMEERSFNYMDEKLEKYYHSCLDYIAETLIDKKQENMRLLKWMKALSLRHNELSISTDYAYSGILYRMFEYEPFRSALDINIGLSDVMDLRTPRNLALLTQIISKYEYLHNIDVFTPKYFEKNTENFFNEYLRLLYTDGIGEYEDDSEYAPSGCVSFLTIHQSKGMEFPIVIVDSLDGKLRTNNDDLLIEIEKKYFKRQPFEPYDAIKYFDFYRLYYTAFSRAQNLLVLTAIGDGKDPNKHFRLLFDGLPSFDSGVCLSKFTFENVRDVDIKAAYSFASHITVYENCTLQYKFFKELEFTPVQLAPTIYGQLVHQTIEDIHRAAIRGEEHLIVEDMINTWFYTNYNTLSKYQHSYLGEPQQKAALKSIMRYVDRQGGRWDAIKEVEVSVSLVKPDYIIEGKIDLIKGENDTVEIVDFKSEKKPDVNRETEKFEQYKKQLQIYAHLIEQNTGQTVSKMHLYYTGTIEGGVPTITFTPNRAEINDTINEFDTIVRKIQNKEFTKKAKSSALCEDCDFRYYCRK